MDGIVVDNEEAYLPSWISSNSRRCFIMSACLAGSTGREPLHLVAVLSLFAKSMTTPFIWPLGKWEKIISGCRSKEKSTHSDVHIKIHNLKKDEWNRT